MSIRVVVAEDIDAIRKRVIRILETDSDIEVVGSACNGREAVLQAALTKPDVLLTDIEMDDRTDGLTAIVQIMENHPETKVVILTVHEEDEMIFKAYEYGVSDYILKNSDREEIITRIKKAHEDTSDIDSDIAVKLKSEFKRIRQVEQSFLYMLNIIVQMTPSELALLKLFIEGKTRREICCIKTVELSTIKSQVNSILKKTQHNSIRELVDMIKKTGMISLIEGAL